jgi:hypothetical protein
MKILFIIFLLLSPVIVEAKQYNVGPYSKQREVNGRSCDQFYIYENGSERYVGSSCS